MLRHLAYQPPRIEGVEISYEDELLLLGSCFSDALGEKLREARFRACSNPLGVIYHPMGLVALLERSMHQHALDERLFLEHEGRVLHYELHSSVCAESAMALSAHTAAQQNKLRDMLQHGRCHWLMLTFGTALVHKLRRTNTIVANCHKQAATNFETEMLSVQAIVAACKGCFAALRACNPKLQIMLTLSPIRYGADMAINSLSKARLRVSIAELCDGHPQTHYFPSYELLMDDLRDYRYYADDLRHPSPTALNYIWERFCETLLSAGTKKQLEAWQQLKTRLMHRFHLPVRNTHLSFLKETHRQATALATTLKLEDILQELAQQIAKLKAQLQEEKH